MFSQVSESNLGYLAVVLTALLGWHWEFLPSFAAKLVPGVDLVPLWTLAVEADARNPSA